MGRNQSVINRQNKKDTEMTKFIKNKPVTNITDLIKMQYNYMQHQNKNQHQKPEQLLLQELLHPKRQGGKNDL